MTKIGGDYSPRCAASSRYSCIDVVSKLVAPPYERLAGLNAARPPTFAESAACARSLRTLSKGYKSAFNLENAASNRARAASDTRGPNIAKLSANRRAGRKWLNSFAPFFNGFIAR